MSTDLTGFISWHQSLDVGISYRSSGTFSLLSSVRVGNFDLGYAYETPALSELAQLNLKTHELFLRIHLGKNYQYQIKNLWKKKRNNLFNLQFLTLN